MHSIALSFFLSLSPPHKWTLDELHFSENILKWRLLNCKLAGVFRKQTRLFTVERVRVHMVARLTKIRNTFSRYFHKALFWGLHLFISGNQVVFLCGQIIHGLNILKDVLVFILNTVDCCTRVTISKQGQLYLLSLSYYLSLCDDTSSYRTQH